MFIQVQDAIYNINSIVIIQLYETAILVKTNEYVQTHHFSNETEAREVFDELRKTLVK